MALIRGRVDLFLLVHRAISKEDIGDVLDITIIGSGRVGPTNDVDVVRDGKLAHLLDKARRILGQRLNGFRRTQFALFEGEELKGKKPGQSRHRRSIRHCS